MTQEFGKRFRRDPSMMSRLYRGYERSAKWKGREELHVESRLRPDPKSPL